MLEASAAVWGWGWGGGGRIVPPEIERTIFSQAVSRKPINIFRFHTPWGAPEELKKCGYLPALPYYLFREAGHYPRPRSFVRRNMKQAALASSLLVLAEGGGEQPQ